MYPTVAQRCGRQEASGFGGELIGGEVWVVGLGEEREEDGVGGCGGREIRASGESAEGCRWGGLAYGLRHGGGDGVGGVVVEFKGGQEGVAAMGSHSTTARRSHRRGG